jgi:parallel beta-helix repeat protein
MKKQIVIVGLFGFINMQATVQPVYPGENLWQIISRIGETVDAIDACCTNGTPETKPCPTCDVEITQAEVPYTITAPGVYCLAEDVSVLLSDPPEDTTVITIQSENVTLNLCGHTIEGGRRGVEIDFDSGPANVTIKNGTIKGATGNGVRLAGVTGPMMLSNLMTTDNHIGVFIYDSTGVTLDYCVSSENDAEGFGLIVSRQCVFRNCIVRNNGLEGFLIQGADEEGNEDCCFTNCKAFENGGIANFYVQNASHNVFIDCVAMAAVHSEDETGYGFRVDGIESNPEYARDNVFFHCTAIHNQEDGFQIHDARDNIIRDCVANNNGRMGINIGTGPVAHCNHVIGCDCVNNGDYGINDTPGQSLILNNLAHDNNSGGYNYGGSTFLFGGWAYNTTEETPTAAIGYWANIGKQGA